MKNNRRRGSRIFSGSTFEELAGYARAVVLPDPGGDWVMVSGTTGFDYAAGTISDDPVEQTHQTFRNIEKALAEAGSALIEATRIRVYVAQQSDFEAIAPIIGQYMGEARPANTSVVSALVDPRMKVEIEVTTRKVPEPKVHQQFRRRDLGLR
jgi:enamine deaminase RidA (YjgF/YER057c/UK114 family)